MVDILDPTTNQPVDMTQFNTTLANFQDFNLKFKQNLDTFKTNADTAGTNLLGNFSAGTSTINDLTKGVSNTVSSLKKASEAAAMFKGNTSGIMEAFDSKKMNSFASTSMDMFSKVMDGAKKAVSNIADTMSGSKSAMGAVGALMGNALSESLKKTLYSTKIAGTEISFDGIQKQLGELDKAALTTGQNFDGSFAAAAQSTNSFRTAFAESLVTTNAAAADIAKVNSALNQFMDVSKSTAPLKTLQDSITGVQASLTASNAAILIATATGADFGDIAKQMGEATYTLGEDIDGAVAMFGKIKQASEGTGVSFKTAASAITNAASTLKYFGGSVSSVAPLFTAFSNSLKDSGIGRQGLTPELLETFVSGLKNMSLSSRALLGLQSTRVSGQSAIGGGLQMEANLEDKTGRGTQEVVKSIVSTLKQFGGGQVLTRDQVLKPGADPALQQQFVMQRQLLGKLGISNDAGQQNKILAMLQNVDKNGLDLSNQAMPELQELLGAGQKTAEATNTDLQKAANATTAAVVTSGENIVSAIKGALSGTGVQKALGGVDRGLRGAAKSGAIDTDKFMQQVGIKDNTPNAQKQLSQGDITKSLADQKAEIAKITNRAQQTYDPKDKDYNEKVNALVAQKTQSMSDKFKSMNLQPPLSKNPITNLNKKSGPNIDLTPHQNVQNQMDNTMRSMDLKRNSDINKSLNMSEANKSEMRQAQQNNQNQQNGQNQQQSPKKQELGLDVKIVNGTVKIDKAYIKEVMSENYRRGVE